MTTMVFSIYDKLAEEYGPTFHAKNNAIANRNYHQLAESQNLKIEEFELVQVGTFDNESGTLTPTT